MPEFRVRVEFDVEVDNPSHIDAAFAAADFLTGLGREDRLDSLVYETAEHSVMHDDTQWKTTDLTEISRLSDDYVIDALNERWHVYVEPDLPDGRRAAWPLVVKKGDEYTRTNNGTGRIIRYSNTDEAQRVADQLNGA